MTKPPYAIWQTIDFVRQHPVSRELADHVGHITPERLNMLRELEELQTGRKEEEHRQKHEKRMAETRERRAATFSTADAFV